MAERDGDTSVIEIVEGLWVVAEDIKAVKRISKSKCTVWIASIEPLVVSCAAEEILGLLGYDLPVDDEEEESEEEDE